MTSGRDPSSQSPPDALRAVALLRGGRLVEAQAEAERLLAREPRLGAAWACLGFSLLQQGKDPLPALEKAGQMLPDDPSVQHVLGQVLEGRGQLARAAACLERTVALRDSLADAHNDLGRVRLALGDIAGATASCRRAIELQPDFAAAHGNLANAQHAAGDLAGAILSYQRVVELEPRLALGHRELGKALHQSGERVASISSLRRAVDLAPDDATARAALVAVLNDHATALVGSGHYDEALRHYRAALGYAPDEARLHSNLSHALQCRGDYRGALAAGQQALALDARMPGAYLHVGNALLALSEIPQAEACYREGLKIAADNLPLLTAHSMALRALGRLDEADATARRALTLRSTPDLLTLRGNLSIDRGQFLQAAELFSQALSLAPESPEALVGVTRTRRMTVQDDAWRAAAERALTGGLPRSHAVNLHHALGKYFEDLGESEPAFRAHASGNALARASGFAYDRAATTDRMNATMAAYNRESLAALHARGSGMPGNRAVFVIGMPRSGTTLVEQILASHPDVFGADELLYWNLAAERVRAAPEGPRAQLIARMAAEYLGMLARRDASAARVVDKLPGNFENVGLIHAALPEARFIHLERDARDTCLSIFFQGFTAAHSYATDLGDLAHYYREYRRVMTHWQHVLPAGSLLTVRYESLVEEPERWVRQMLQHIDLPWDARCLDFHRNERSVLTASSWQVRQPLNRASIGRWRHYEAFLSPLIIALEDNAAEPGA